MPMIIVAAPRQRQHNLAGYLKQKNDLRLKYLKLNTSLNIVYQKRDGVLFFCGEFCALLFIYI